MRIVIFTSSYIMSLSNLYPIIMKKITLVLLLLISFGSFAEDNAKKVDFTNPDDVDGAQAKYSLLRMQNKVIAGLEVSINPSLTKIDESLVRTLANFRIGYRLNNHVLSGSLGVEFTDEMFLPITIDYKYYFNREKVWAPYVYGQAGYSWHLKRNINSRYNTSQYSQYDGGALASVGFGYSYTTTLNEFFFSLGYSYRNYVEVKPPQAINEVNKVDRTMNGVAITVGVNF